MTSAERLFGRVAEPGWIMMDFNNSFKCQMGGDDISKVQLDPRLWNLRPIVKGTKHAVKVPAWPETYADVKEHQEAWLAGSSPLPERCAQYPLIRRMLLEVTSPGLAPRIGAAQYVEE